VRGYVLARDGDIPRDAVAYEIAVFRKKEEAARFCPAFLKRLTFEGGLTAQTELSVTSRGKPVEIAPFIWPVTAWTAADKAAKPTCEVLVARYDYAGARTFLAEAKSQLGARADLGGALASSDGPFIVVARKAGATTVFDLSRAPDVDWDGWLVRTIDAVEAGAPVAAAGGKGVVAPGLRDQLRYYVFAAVPAIDAALGVFVPGYAKAAQGG